MTQPRLLAKTFLCLSACLTLANATLAEDKVYKEQTLSNGMTLVSIQQRKVPLVTVVLTFKAGAMTETKDVNGFTHVWEHMFFTGNKKMANESGFMKRQRQLGMVSNAATSAEYVHYYFTLPSGFLNEGLELMADCIKTPLLAKESLLKERVVVLDEYDRSASQPGFNLYRVKRAAMYGTEQHRRDPLGVRELIANVTREQLLKIKDQVFVPTNAALLVGGDFDEAKLKSLVEKHFHDWKDPKDWKAPVIPEFPAFPNTTELVEIHPDAQNVDISYSFAGPRVRKDDADTIAADVLLEALRHRSGRFYKKFVDSGLSLGAGLSYYTQAQAGEVVVYGSSVAKNAKKLEEQLLAEIQEWTKEDYFTNGQLEDVSRGMFINNKRELNKPSEFVKTLTFSWTVTGLKYFDTYLQALSKITRKDLANFVSKYLVKKPYVKTVITSPDEAKIAGYKDNLDPYLKAFNLKRAGQ